MLAGIEAGGTKFVCAVAHDPQNIIDEIRFPTTRPEETIAKAVNFFREMEEKHGSISSLGLGCFGPLDPDPASNRYGYITATPKPGWRDVDIIGMLKQHFSCPIGFDTDVNGAALGEYLWGAGKNCDVLLYITIGTGVGGGVLIHGKPLHGLTHPEVGHIFLPRSAADQGFSGVCPYHGDCLEGLVSGPALEARTGLSGKDIPEDHESWDVVADYIAAALSSYICILSPQKIILGGGVMAQQHLLDRVRNRVPEMLNGYVPHPAVTVNIDRYIIPTGLGDKSGVMGAFALGLLAAGA